MFFSEHRLKIASLRIGKHRIVKNIASLRKVNIAHPYTNLVEHNFWLQVKILNFAADYSWLTHVGQEYDSKKLACQVSTLSRHIRLTDSR